jgi:hypothetical protein
MRHCDWRPSHALRRLLLPLALASAACPLAGQRAAPAAAGASPGASGSVFVGCGYLLAENHGRESFTILLRGGHVHSLPVESGEMWVIDDVLVELTSVRARDLDMPSARGAALLRAHRGWELAFTARSNGWPPIRASGGQTDAGQAGIPTLLWEYDVPGVLTVFGQRIPRVMYLTAAIGDLVFVMGLPMRASDDPTRVARIASRAMRSLRRANGPVDLNALARQVRAHPQPWPSCIG